MTERKQWLDSAKGIGILLVAIGHNGVLCNFLPLHSVIFAFHMPLFFILSGITISPSTSAKNIAIRSASLYWVYLAVCLATIPFALNRSDAQGAFNAVLGIIYGCGFTIHMTPLWYLVCLAIATPIAWAFIRILGDKSLTAMVIACLTFLFLGWLILDTTKPTSMQRILAWGDGHQGMILNLDLVPTAVGFLLMGRLLTKLVPRIASTHWSVALLFAASLIVLVNYATPNLDLNLRSAPGSFFLYLSSSIVGSLLVFWVCLKFNLSIFSQIGGSTLPILAFHPALTNKISFIDRDSLLLAITGTIVGVAIPFFADKFFFKRYSMGQLFFYPRTILKI